MARAHTRGPLQKWRFVLSLSCLVSVWKSGAVGALDLAALQAEAHGGYIRLDDSTLTQAQEGVAEGKHSLFIFFDATNQPQFSREHVEPLLLEFNVASKSYEASRDKSADEGPHRVFFCVMDFPHSEGTYRRMEIRTLPHIRFLSKDLGETGASVDCQFVALEDQAEAFLNCLSDISGLKVGPISRPQSPQQQALAWIHHLGLPFAVLGAIVFLLGAWNALSQTVTRISMPLLSLIGCALSLLVYVISISGFMYTIINKMPMYYIANLKPLKLKFVLQSSEQLGLEGFGAGLLYTSVGVGMAFVINVAPLINSRVMQRLLAYFCELSCLLSVLVLVYFQKWKTSGADMYD